MDQRDDRIPFICRWKIADLASRETEPLFSLAPKFFEFTMARGVLRVLSRNDDGDPAARPGAARSGHSVIDSQSGPSWLGSSAG